MREDYYKIINNINALVNTSVSDLPHEQQPGPSTSGDTSEFQRIEYDSDTSTSDSDSGSDSDTSCIDITDIAREETLGYDGTII